MLKTSLERDKNTIINADDFGMSNIDNEAILECFKKNIIDTTTIMVNAPAFKDAVKISLENNISNKVGLHLTLTEFRPITNITSKKFVNSQGFFYNNLKLRKSLSIFFLTKKERKLLSSEIEAQIIKYRKYFKESTFLDSHHHIHTTYSILKIIIPLAKKYGFTRIRIPQSCEFIKINFFVKIYKKFLEKKIKKHFPDTVDYFYYLNTYLERKDSICMKRKEVMIHPMLKSGVIFDKFFDKYELSGVDL